MKTTIKNTLAAALLTGAVAVSGLTACSSSEDSIAEETPVVNPTAQTYRMSIPATMDDGTTRAVNFEGTTSTSTFTTSERVYVYNVTTGKALSGYLSPTNLSADSKSCDLSGTLTGSLNAGDEIKLLYNLRVFEVYYINNQSNLNYCFFSCDKQDGTPSGVRDGAMATATVGSDDGSGTLTTTAPASFTNVQSMFRFQFTDGTSPISVKLLRITSENEAVSEFYYPLITNGSKYNYDPINVTLATPTTEYIYVALCFDESRTSGDVLKFRVQDADGYIYEGTRSAPTGGFKNGKYYWNSSAITLTKTGQLVKPTLSRSDGGDADELENAEADNCFYIYPSWINNVWVPINVTMSGTSIGYGFSFDDGGTSTTVNLNGLNATYAESESFIYSQSGPLTLNLTGSNSISCSNYYDAIYSKGDLKLSGNGTLTVTANATSYYGLIGSNYKNGSNSDASVLAAPGYTVTRSAVTNNQDGTYTWTYTVADTKADYREGAWSGTAVTFTKKTASNPTEIANGYSGNIVSGWYTVTGDDVVISSDVTLTGDTHLILCDGAKLTVNGRIYGSKTYGLYVYGQESGTGKLVVNGDSYIAMDKLSLLEVHGGGITAESSGFHGIVYTPITVYGGKLTAKATNTSQNYGINNNSAGNDINIYGGELVASSNSSECAIKLNLTSNASTLTVYGGKLSASSPQGQTIQGYIKSGTEGIKFYFADTEGDWDGGKIYNYSQVAEFKPYAKAE